MNSQNTKATGGGRILVAKNRKARHNYAIEETIEAGLVLLGSEVKAVRQGDVQIDEAYVRVRNTEVRLENAYIGEYAQAASFPHEARRARPLLLKRREIARLADQQKLKGMSIVPLALYFLRGWLKVELGVGKGKRTIDRRATIKERSVRREIERTLRRG